MSTTPTKPVKAVKTIKTGKSTKPVNLKNKTGNYRNGSSKNRPASSVKRGAKNARDVKSAKIKNTGRKNICKDDFHESEIQEKNTFTFQLLPFVIIIAAVYIFICFLMNDARDDVGGLGVFIRNTFYGLFSNTAIFIPYMMVSTACFYKKDSDSGFLKYRLIFSVVCLILYSALTHLFSDYAGGFSISSLFLWGKNHQGGGVLGGVLTEVLIKCVGTIGTGIFLVSLSVIFSIFLFGCTPMDVIKIAAALIEGYKKSRHEGFEREFIINQADNAGFFKAKSHKYRILSHTAHRNSGISQSQKQKHRRKQKRKFEYKNRKATVKPTIELRMGSIAKSRRYNVSHETYATESDATAVINPTSTINTTNTTDTIKNDKLEEDLANAVNSDYKNNIGFTENGGEIFGDSIASEIMPEQNNEPLWIPEKSFFEAETAAESSRVKDRNSKSNKNSRNGRGGGSNGNKNKIYSHPDILESVDDILLDGVGDADIYERRETDGADLFFSGTNALNKSDAPNVMRGDTSETQADEHKSRELSFETSKVFGDYRDNMTVKEYKLPPLSYLSKDTSTANVDVSGELAFTASRLIETLNSFGVKARVSAVSRGPSVTRYEVTPNAGVKVKSIVNLVDDIALNLAAGGVRIEAPIPGKAAVGVEVPNKTVSTVYLRTLLEEAQFRQAASRITVALGMDVAGKPIYSDISRMPHLLIAGATGMGKSVCINSIITSVLYKARPNEVKLMLIDPKKVELTIYNGIPHLLVPVVSDPKKAAGTLNWAVAEMESRFLLIEERGVRDLKSYNDAVADDPMTEKLPQIIIIIDELADLMMTAPVDVEQSICRLAQKARAAGMHLIIGTQRPSVDVITGLIKANIPSRIAFTVASQIDSRTIIDAKGAEELIGRGDMLYLPVGAAKPIRVQGAYVSERDVMNVTEFLKKQSDGGYDKDVLNKIESEAQQCNTKGAKLATKENA